MCKWDGKGHSVSGMYFNDVTQTGVAFFNCSMKFKNLTIKNIFIQAKGEVAPLQYGTSSNVELDNIKTYGTIKAEYSVFGIVNDGQKITNCENHVNIKQIDLGLTKRGSFGGITLNGSVVENCKNYGNIEVFYATYVGGIVANNICYNSANYGNITIVSHPSGAMTGVGGICGIVNGYKDPLKNCKNYGRLIKNGPCTFSGAILGYLYTSARIEDCTNYGALTGFTAFVGGDTSNCKETSEIVGCKNYGRVENACVFIRAIDSNINFIDCHNYGDVFLNGQRGVCFDILQDNCQIINCSFTCAISGSRYNSSYFNVFGFVHGADRNLIINNFKADVTFFDTGGYFTFLGYVAGGSAKKQNFEIKNSKFDYDIKDSRLNNIYILSNIEKYGSLTLENVEIINKNISNVSLQMVSGLYGRLSVKNLIIREYISKQVAFGKIASSFNEGYTLNISGLVRQMFAGDNVYGQFYGSNFAGLYLSWSTGKIGIIALDGRGTFQGRIDEDWLLNKGYTKKTI